jgi:ribosomal protein S18 acetylase RimI-like enzyme
LRSIFTGEAMMDAGDIDYRISPPLDNKELNALYRAAWAGHGEQESDFGPVLAHSLVTIGAYDGARLVGFVYVAWDGGIHGFLLDPTVHPDYGRRGIGRRLVAEAATVAQARGLVWLHVDYEPHLESFYQQCGFRPTLAGLIHLNPDR